MELGAAKNKKEDASKNNIPKEVVWAGYVAEREAFIEIGPGELMWLKGGVGIFAVFAVCLPCFVCQNSGN